MSTGAIVAFGDRRLPARFWVKAHLDPGTGCWLWDRSLRDGYGQIRWHGAVKDAHVVTYIVFIGPVPPRLVLDHFVCDTRRCCNPFHVRPVSRWENALRGETIVAAQLAKSHCPRGHALIPGNLVVGKLKLGWRECRICARDWHIRRLIPSQIPGLPESLPLPAGPGVSLEEA